MTHLNLLIIVVQSSNPKKVFFAITALPCSGANLTSQLRPLIKNSTITQKLPWSQNYLVAHTLTLPNNPPNKIHHLKSLMKSHKHRKPRKSYFQLLQLANLQITLIITSHRTNPPPRFTPQLKVRYPPIRVKLKYNKRKHNNNNNNNNKIFKIFCRIQALLQKKLQHPIYLLYHQHHNQSY